MVPASPKPFLISLHISLLCVLLVIGAGATVRATGSGMGCPDWPLCYDCWIPPVSVDQLPADYATRFAVQGQPAHFDAVQTWIEYINRLLGVTAGLAVVVSLGFAVVYRRLGWGFPVVGLLVTALMGLVAWLGALVVDSFLEPFAVTLHLLVALTILALLLYQRERVLRLGGRSRAPVPRTAFVLLVVTGVSLATQLWLGIQVRESNELGWIHPLPTAWLALPPGAFDVLHRVSAGVLGASATALALFAWRSRAQARRFWQWSRNLALMVAVQAGLGLVLLYWHPATAAKPLHLLSATAVFCCWWLALFSQSSPKKAPHAV